MAAGADPFVDPPEAPGAQPAVLVLTSEGSWNQGNNDWQSLDQSGSASNEKLLPCADVNYPSFTGAGWIEWQIYGDYTNPTNPAELVFKLQVDDVLVATIATGAVIPVNASQTPKGSFCFRARLSPFWSGDNTYVQWLDWDLWVRPNAADLDVHQSGRLRLAIDFSADRVLDWKIGKDPTGAAAPGNGFYAVRAITCLQHAPRDSS